MSFCRLGGNQYNVLKKEIGQTGKKYKSLTGTANYQLFQLYGKKIYLSASATVEAALVVPLYIFSVMAVTYILQIFLIKGEINRAVYNSLRQMSEYGYVSFKIQNAPQEIPSGVFYAYLLNELGSEFASDHHIVGGNAGFLLSGSEFTKENGALKLVLQYAVRNPFDVFGNGLIRIKQNWYVQAWLGADYIKQESNLEAEQTWVYVTPYGTVYHTNRFCSHIQLNITEVEFNQIVDLRNESGGKYYPCEKCDTEMVQSSVYITRYGDRYHQNANCSKLKRSVIRVPIHSVSDRNLCSKCREE